MAKKSPSKRSPQGFVFKAGAGASIGKIAAEEDATFLETCFVDAGHLGRALDCGDSGSIFVGRTGAGKSAALLQIARGKEKNVILIDPSALSLRYISNSNVLRFFEAVPIDLDLFYQLLWRHVFTIELLNYRYRVQKIADFHALVDRVRESVFHQRKKTECIRYLTDYETDFFKSTQERVKYAVEKFEMQMKSKLDLAKIGVPLSAEGAANLSTEKRTEVEDMAKKVVSDIQMDKLSIVNDFMAEFPFSDPKNSFYILVDKLDEDWVSDTLRFKLIRALIETIRAFRKIRSVKILVALRQDLLDHVYEATKTRGFQREKYQEYEIPVSWSRANLLEMTDKRIRHLVKRQYTKEEVGFKQLFPPEYKGSGDMFDHLLSRTLHRPRDMIQFVNGILEECAGKTAITASSIDDAEVEYSKRRRAALVDEWRGEHPSIEKCFELFRGGFSQFKISDLPREKFEALGYSIVSHDDILGRSAKSAIGETGDIADFIKVVLQVLYKVGFVSVRPYKGSGQQSSYLGGSDILAADITDEARFYISPMVWRALNIRKGQVAGYVEQA